MKWQRRRTRLFTKKEVHMQKLRSKLGLVAVLSCLTLAIGLVASTGSASAHEGGHHPASKVSPRIAMKVLSGRFKFHSHYVQRVVLSGVGFDTCDSCGNTSAYNGCDGSCNNGCSACSSSCPYSYYDANACDNACNQGCGSTDGNSCANYNVCGTDGGTGYSSCPSNCGGTTGNVVIGSASKAAHPVCARPIAAALLAMLVLVLTTATILLAPPLVGALLAMLSLGLIMAARPAPATMPVAMPAVAIAPMCKAIFLSMGRMRIFHRFP